MIGYDLMNEPTLASVSGNYWSHPTGPAQAGVTAIRDAGSTKTIVVEFDGFSQPRNVAGQVPFVVDPEDNVRYSVHVYLDYASSISSKYTPEGSQRSIYYLNLKNCKDAGFTGTDVFPTVSQTGVSDSFDRTDTLVRETLGTTEDPSSSFWHNSRDIVPGGDYRGDTGFDWYILNNVATNYNGDTAACWVKTGISDGSARVTLPHLASSGGLWFRGAMNGSSGLLVDVGGIYKVVRSTSGAATFTTLTSWASPGYVSGDTIRVDFVGDQISVTKTHLGVDSVLGTAVSSYNQTEQCHGLWILTVGTPRTTWSDFSVFDDNALPVASFVASRGVSYPVQFTSTSTDDDGTIVAYDWEFGDGDFSTEENPLHVYDTPGTYTVILTVTDDHGAQTATPGELVLLGEAVSVDGSPGGYTQPILAGPFVGQTLTATPGTWIGDAPIAYAYQWEVSDDGETGWTEIPFASTPSHVVPAGELGKYVRCKVTATNTVGAGDPEASSPLGPIRPAVVPPTPPRNSSPGGSMLPQGTTVYLPRKSARKTGFKRRRV